MRTDSQDEEVSKVPGCGRLMPWVQLVAQSRPVLHLAVASVRRLLSGDYVWR